MRRGEHVTLCGEPADHLAWFEGDDFDLAGRARCRRCARAESREQRAA